MSAEWKHDALAADLARWLKNGGEHWCWLNSALGEWGGPRPDIMAYRRYRYQTPLLRAYEAKISRADLLSDLRAEKWRSYLEHCISVTFIMPSGLCKKEEIPAECGVMFRTGRGWRTERRPQDIGVSASVVAMAKLLTLHPIRPQPETTHWVAERYRDHAARAFTKEMGDRLGKKAGWYFEQVAKGKDPVEQARAEAEKIKAEAVNDAAAILKDCEPLIAALGLPMSASQWQIASAIKQRAKLLSADGQLRAVSAELANVSRALEAAKSALSPPLSHSTTPASEEV